MNQSRTGLSIIARQVIALILRAMLTPFYSSSIMSGKFFDDGALTGYKILLSHIWPQKVLGLHRKAPWPLAPSSVVSNYSRLHFHPDDIMNLLSPGCYFQNFSADISIGHGTYIAPNVGIITANHRIDSLTLHDAGEPVTIGERCWIGMNSVILPGVVLGDQTVVGAGSVVTHSFEQGKCIIAGNPARLLRTIE